MDFVVIGPSKRFLEQGEDIGSMHIIHLPDLLDILSSALNNCVNMKTSLKKLRVSNLFFKAC